MEVGSEPAARPPGNRSDPEPVVARNLLDLDIICVDDRTAGGASRAPEVVELDDSSSSETDNSSDFEDETDGREKMDPKRQNVRTSWVYTFVNALYTQITQHCSSSDPS